MHTNGKIVSWYSKERLSAGKVRVDTFISSEWRLLPFIPIIHQNRQQRKAYDQYCLQRRLDAGLAFLQIVSTDYINNRINKFIEGF
jgi:hypothetical protein